jgi:hypothetical protein
MDERKTSGDIIFNKIFMEISIKKKGDKKNCQKN